MALILAFQHPVLGYCGCSHDFFLEDCQCTLAPESDCSCCHESCPLPETTEHPCKDCCEKFSLDLGDILWTSSPEPEAFTGAELTPLPLTNLTALSRGRTIRVTLPPSRPPPPGPCPLFLRLGVMRL